MFMRAAEDEGEDETTHPYGHAERVDAGQLRVAIAPLITISDLGSNRIILFVCAQADDKPESPPIHVGMLSVSMLLNGYSYFIPRLHLLKEVPALVRHCCDILSIPRVRVCACVKVY